MTIELNYNNRQEILTFRAKGCLSVDDIELSMYKIFDSNDIPHNVNAIWDLREMSFENIDITFLQQLVAMKKKHNSKRGSAKIAILSNYTLAAPLVKLYIILSKNLSQLTSAFKTQEEAEFWLCKDLFGGLDEVGKLN